MGYLNLLLTVRVIGVICYFHHTVFLSKVVRGEKVPVPPSPMLLLGVPGAVFVAFRSLVSATVLQTHVCHHDLVTRLSFSIELLWFLKVSPHARVQMSLQCKGPRFASVPPAQSQLVW